MFQICSVSPGIGLIEEGIGTSARGTPAPKHAAPLRHSFPGSGPVGRAGEDTSHGLDELGNLQMLFVHAI
jgi:hypothetical protein